MLFEITRGGEKDISKLKQFTEGKRNCNTRSNRLDREKDVGLWVFV